MKSVCGLNFTPVVESPTDKRTEDLRFAILQDYPETVFRKELWRDALVQGPYGMAYMPLGEGAVPFAAKRFLYAWRKSRGL